MKKRRLSVRTLAAAAAGLIFGAAAVPALANTAFTLPIADADDADGNTLLEMAAILLESEDGDALVYTSLDLYTSEASTYAVYTTYDEDNNWYGYYLTSGSTADELGLIEWVLEDGGEEDAVIGVSSAYKGKVVTAYYYNSSWELATAEVTVTGYSTDSNGNYVLQVDSLPDAYVYPILLADSSGNCVGIAGTADTNMVYAPYLEEDLFYSVSTGSSASQKMILLVVIAAIVVVVVIVVLKKKKGGKNPDQGSSAKADGPAGGNGDLWGDPGVASGGSDPWGDSGGASGSSGDHWGNSGGTNGGSGDPWGSTEGETSGGSDPWGNSGGAAGRSGDSWGNSGGTSGHSGDPWGNTGERAGSRTAGGAEGQQDINFENPQEDISGKFCVVCLEGVMKGGIYPIGNYEITFGRDASCTVCFPADTKGVSRMHCKLLWQNGTLMLMDCGSSYGTYAAQGRLQPNVPVAITEGENFYLAEEKNCFRIQMIGRGGRL